MVAAVDLRPDTQGLMVVTRPATQSRLTAELPSRLQKAPSSVISDQSISPLLSSSAGSTSEPLTTTSKLSAIEVEALLREKVRTKVTPLQQAFQTYDIDQNASVTKGEFRRVLEQYCFVMTTEQFSSVLAKVDKNSNGTVRYCDFIDKFYGGKTLSETEVRERMASKKTKVPNAPAIPSDVNVDMLEALIRDKMVKNAKNMVKAFRLFDYNRDGKIQRHELRRVLDNSCFKLTDPQFDKLWQRHDFHHSGIVDYNDFLKRIGIVVSSKREECVKSSLSWAESEKNRREEVQRSAKDQQAQNQLRDMNFGQIDAEFRRLMKANYLDIKKACVLVDHHLDGWMNVEDLHNILSNFTIPLTSQLFKQLTDRLGIKASGRVKWEHFLEKFQDPRDVGNGQTVPIKPNHKWFPLRGGDEVLKAGEIQTMLESHVNNNYTSIKDAFLQFDGNRDGIISRGELRRIIERFTFRLTDAQFKELVTILDPQHKGRISYHAFMDLFEQKESLTAHKWLKSVHRVNEMNKPAVLAWKTIEGILCEKIEYNWKDIKVDLGHYDPFRSGIISTNQLRRIINKYAIPVSNEHFESHAQILISAANRVGYMTADDVIHTLKDRMAQHSSSIRKSFLGFVNNDKSTISKKAFRDGLASFGMYMRDDQFEHLASTIGFNNGPLHYYSFLDAFDGSRTDAKQPKFDHPSNHRVNEIRGQDFGGMDALTAELFLRRKLRENFDSLRHAFFKMDTNHDGILRKSNFRQILDSFMVDMCKDEFDQLCARLGVTAASRINYRQFLDMFEVREGHSGCDENLSTNMIFQHKPTELVTADHVYNVLCDRIYDQWSTLAKAFLTIDKGGKGVIKRRQLRRLLHHFSLHMSHEEFKVLWAMLDEEGQGYLTADNFLSKIGGPQYGASDVGVSERIIEESHQTLDDHQMDQTQKHERMTYNQAVLGCGLKAEDVLQSMKDKIRDHYADFYVAFRRYDTKGRGYLKVTEIHRALLDLHFFLNEDEFVRLLDLLGLKADNQKLDYDLFLKAFEEGRASSYGKRERGDIRVVDFRGLSNEKAEQRMADKVANQQDSLRKAFAVFDRNKTGKLSQDDFRRTLDLFCFKLTDQQYRHIMQHTNAITSDRCVDYGHFLGQYAPEPEKNEKWMTSMQKVLLPNRPGCPHLLQPMPLHEVQERLRECVMAHFYTLAQEFAEVDYAKIDVVSKDDFRLILHKNIFRLTDDQFEKLWGVLPVNDFGNLSYIDFLKLYSSDPVTKGNSYEIEVTRSPSHLAKRPQTSHSQPRSKTSLDFHPHQLPRPITRLSTPLVNAKSVERELQDKIFRSWQDIQKQCRLYDTKNSGMISVYKFRDIISAKDINLSDDQFHKLMQKYDIDGNGQLCYSDFLRHFVLTLKPKEVASIHARPKLHKSKTSIVPGQTSTEFYDAMLRVHDCVSTKWKDMRRSFRTIDPQGSGIINSLDFKRVLKTYNIDLSQEEFYQMMTYYDNSMRGNVRYNDFLRAFLRD